MKLSYIFSIDQDIVQVHYNKNIKLFSKNLINIALKTSGCVGKAKEHHLVLEVAVFDAESRLLLVTLSNSHSMIGTNKIQLGKPLGPA